MNKREKSASPLGSALVEKIRKSARARKRGLNLGQAAREAGKESGEPAYRVARALFSLREEGAITLSDPSPPTSMREYIANYRGLPFWVAVGLVALTALFALFPPSIVYLAYARYAIGGIFVLFLPGYALIESFFPKNEDLTPLERLAFSMGLSICIVPLIILALSYTPWGVGLGSTILVLAVANLGLSSVSIYRKTQVLNPAPSGKGGKA